MEKTDLAEGSRADAELLARAQAGDGDAFREVTEPFRREIHVHCYRILGSVQDAEDALQETMVAAWRGIDRFEGRSSLRAWLYRIATNQCLNSLRGAVRRAPQSRQGSGGLGQLGAAGQLPPLPEPATDDEPLWLQPYPDVLLDELPDTSPGPAARYEARESISLAFITALQHLPPRQRATLVLRDALGFRAAETADILGCSLDAVNGSLKRARASLAQRLPAGGLSQAPLPGSGTERELLARFTDAFEHGDVAALVAMLTDDTWLTMPPLPFGYRGRDAAAHLLSVVSFRGGSRRFRLVAARANGQPAFGCYITDAPAPIAHAHGLMMLTLAGDRIAGVTRFLDNSLLAGFGLPRTLPDYHPRHARYATPDDHITGSPGS
jgi:RNA polymerase sigma-70 factor (ECF subfamily)